MFKSFRLVFKRSGNRFGDCKHFSLCKDRGIILNEPSVVAVHEGMKRMSKVLA